MYRVHAQSMSDLGGFPPKSGAFSVCTAQHVFLSRKISEKNKLFWKPERSSGSHWMSFGCLAVLAQSRSPYRDIPLVSVHAKERKTDLSSCKLQWDCQSGKARSTDNPSNGGFCRDAPAGWNIPTSWALPQPVAPQLCATGTPPLHPRPRLANTDPLILHLVLSAEFLSKALVWVNLGSDCLGTHLPIPSEQLGCSSACLCPWVQPNWH